MKRLRTLLDAVDKRRAAPEWVEGQARVAASYAALLDYLERHPETQIYGFNTLSGHRDDHRLDDDAARAFQDELIASHVISDAPDYDQRLALTITATKIAQLSHGGATLSAGLYGQLLAAFENVDFAPSVPRQSSYSCGDVIPGAHWARGVLDYLAATGTPYRLGRGEGMALINGSFVHLGYAAGAARPLAALWAMQLDAARSDLVLGRADAGMLDYARQVGTALPSSTLDYLGATGGPLGGAQWPVSFRAIPETLALLFTSYREFFGEIDRELGLPSGNPLLAPGAGGLRPHAQASFMLPLLAVRTSAVLEALMFSASAELGRVKWLLSGNVEGIPLDGQLGGDDIAFIQWPKLMQAMVEELRMVLGRTLYASGGDTSFGVEDLWSNGVTNLDRLVAAVDLTQRIVALGLRLKARVGLRFGRDAGLGAEVVALATTGADARAETRALIGHYSGPRAAALHEMVLG